MKSCEKCWTMLKNGEKNWKVVKSGEKCWKVVKNGEKSWKVVKMLKSGEKWWKLWSFLTCVAWSTCWAPAWPWSRSVIGATKCSSCTAASSCVSVAGWAGKAAKCSQVSRTENWKNFADERKHLNELEETENDRVRTHWKVWTHWVPLGATGCCEQGFPVVWVAAHCCCMLASSPLRRSASCRSWSSCDKSCPVAIQDIETYLKKPAFRHLKHLKHCLAFRMS